eukprot:TRINITY_DN3228_c0_g1_i1.p1 TRINITY_DN3228_c0_g1~~TRINITY_DN3228_c0_g1_i1.p1  ORF type:complete len:154 (-),score=26.38 TRINITY_DN3228_c0_g1_i1:275-736(-)
MSSHGGLRRKPASSALIVVFAVGSLLMYRAHPEDSSGSKLAFVVSRSSQAIALGRSRLATQGSRTALGAVEEDVADAVSDVADAVSDGPPEGYDFGFGYILTFVALALAAVVGYLFSLNPEKEAEDMAYRQMSRPPLNEKASRKNRRYEDSRK